MQRPSASIKNTGGDRQEFAEAKVAKRRKETCEHNEGLNPEGTVGQQQTDLMESVDVYTKQ